MSTLPFEGFGQGIPQIQPMQFNIPAPKPRGGMFGGKALSVIAEALAAYSAGMGNPAGMAVLQGMNHRRQSKADAERQEQQYQQQRQHGLEDYRAKLGIQQEFAKPEIPDIQERINVLESIRPGLGITYAEKYANNGGGLGMNFFTDPASGQKFIMPQLPQVGAEMDDPRKQGGPRPLGVGGFPGPF